MEVILRQDVPSLGKAGQIVKVKPGHARNFLFPKGLAYEATDGNKKRIAAEQAAPGRQAQRRAVRGRGLGRPAGGGDRRHHRQGGR